MRWGASAVRRQTEYILRHKITPTLDAAGSSWEHVVKAQVYLDNVDDLPDFLDVWSDHLGDIPCALTVVSATTLRLVGGVIEINLVAMRDGARNGKEVVDADLPDLASFGPCVRAGDFLFPSGLMGVADDGRVVGDTVSPALGGLAHAGHAQASAIYGYVDALCSAAGASIADVVRAQYFVTDIRDFPGVTTAWAARHADEPHPFWCLQVPSVLPATAATVIADFWIYAPRS